MEYTYISFSFAYIATIILTVLTGLLALDSYCASLPRPQHKSKDPAICKSILGCKGTLGPGFGENVQSAARCRALPNHRLVKFFGINNSFTSSRRSRVKAFRSAAKERFFTDQEMWRHVSGAAKEIVSARLVNFDDTPLNDIRLDNLVRSLCLRITLVVFFDHNPWEIDEDSVQEVTDRINEMWVKSKSQTSPTSFEDRCMRDSMRNICLPVDGVSSQENPLNFILPAYETLWRVVLFCFLEVMFRDEADTHWCDILEHFAEAPVRAKFEQPNPASENISAKFIVKEALRMYPSTKRVYRTFRKGYSFKYQDFVADIEGCHRNPDIWDAPNTFIPSRWSDISQEARQAWMPFGHGILACPAQSHYGPWIIAVLVAALSTHIKKSDFALSLHKEGGGSVKGLPENEPLAADRTAYRAIIISRREL